MNRWTLVASAVTLLFTAPARAADIVVPSSMSLIFDPFSGAASSTSTQILVRMAEGENPPASIRIQPSDGRPWRFDPAGPRFLLRTGDGAESAGPSLVAPLTFSSSGQEVKLDLQLVVPASQFVAAGDHEAELEAVLLDRSGAPLGPSRFIRLALQAPPRAQANIAGSSGNFGSAPALAFLDFGELTTGESLSAFLQVRANAPVVITASSENEGRLVSLDSSRNAAVDYRLEIDGAVAALRAPLVLRRQPPPSLGGISYPLRVTIGNVGGAFAGTYRDVLTVDVSAL